MSIYATGHILRLPVDVPCRPEEKDADYYAHGDDISGTGRPVRERWIEVVCQHVPNHLNEENGYDWDWLPAFTHKVGCVRKVHTMVSSKGEPYSWTDCDCGDRCVFVLDEDHEDKDGQRYTEPLLVLSGTEYEAATFDGLLSRISYVLEARFGVQGGGTKVIR
jgi:hypothetical protein